MNDTTTARIEKQLRYYRVDKQAYQDRLSELISPGQSGSLTALPPKTNEHGDPTGKKAAVINADDELQSLHRGIKQVERLLDALTTRQVQYVETRYFDGRTHVETCERVMGISERSGYRIRNQILKRAVKIWGL